MRFVYRLVCIGSLCNRSHGRKAFYEYLAAETIVKLRQDQIQSAQTFYDAAVKRAQAGFASDFETVKGQADLISAQKLGRAAEGNVTTARVELNTLLGRAPSSPLHPTGALEGTVPKYTAENYVGLAMAQNPSLRTQELQANLAGLNLRKTRFGRRPDFAIGPAVEYSSNAGERTYALRATVALPLWNQAQGEIQTATAEQEKTLAEIEKLRGCYEKTVCFCSGGSATAWVARLACRGPHSIRYLPVCWNPSGRSRSSMADRWRTSQSVSRSCGNAPRHDK